MSVALLIVPRNGGTQRRLTPVATQDVFRVAWLAGATTLGLRWVPLFESGTAIDREDLPDVIQELHLLLTWAEGSHESIVERVRMLITELDSLRDSAESMDIFIG
jgi:hypothetical protein